jgi:hypothetical protein
MNNDPTRIGNSTQFDEDIWKRIEQVSIKSQLTFPELIELWPLFLRRVSLSRTVALYEIFKIIKDVPGNIVECGVFRGQSLSLFRQLIEVFNHGDSLKKIIGFDTFEGFRNLSDQDGPDDSLRAKFAGGWDSSQFLPYLEELLEIMQLDSYLPRVKRVELIKGDVTITVPEYIKKNPGLRISLLNLDLDLYEPTLVALKHLFPLVTVGGIVILDEYAMTGFPGESAAFDEFFSKLTPALKKFNFTPTPGGYFVKH